MPNKISLFCGIVGGTARVISTPPSLTTTPSVGGATALAASDSISQEEWRVIPGFDGLYEVSSIGRMRSLQQHRCSKQRTPPKLMTPTPAVSRGGYLRVRLRRNGKPVTCSVHRLVLLAFVGEPSSPNMHGAHLDNNPSNNCVANLVWATCKENLSHRVAHGTAPRGERQHTAKITAADVVAIRRRRRAGESNRSIARDFPINSNEVSAIALGRAWPHINEPVAQPLDCRKLTAEKVAAIRSRHAAGESGVAMAREFGISQTNIYAVIRGQTWRHVA